MTAPHQQPQQAPTTATTGWTADDMLDQTGRVMIVTGGNAGIGRSAARDLLKKGATVVLACRSETRGRTAEQQLNHETQGTRAVYMPLDLSDLDSVRAFASAFQQRFDRLDVLINNAGLVGDKFYLTKAGVELTFAVNHLGHFVLTALLFDLLKRSAPSRIVTVTSGSYLVGRVQFESIAHPKEARYYKALAYTESKLANMLFTYELTRRIQAAGVQGVMAVSCHPGGAKTNHIMDAAGESRLQRLLFKWVYDHVCQDAESACRPTLYAATADVVHSGGLYGPYWWYRGAPCEERVSARGQDPQAAARLWQLSQALADVEFPV